MDSSSSQQQENLTALFAQTISSLAADAKALKQILCLQEATSKDVKYEDALLNLEAGVTLVEDKVQALQQITHDERQALDIMDDMYEDSLEQNVMLKKLLRDAKERNQQQQQNHHKEKNQHKQQTRLKTSLSVATTLSTPTQIGKKENHDKENIVESLRRLNIESPFVATPNKSRQHDSGDVPRRTLTPSSSYQQSHQLMPLAGEAVPLQGIPSTIRMQLISSDELLAVARTVRGRITLAVLNDAVRDIERVCVEKYDILQGKRLRHHYRKYWMLHRALEVEELHGQEPWVSEQDLRNACAFFRSGEATARSILAILRTLRRLKQVPGRNSQVTYIITQ